MFKSFKIQQFDILKVATQFYQSFHVLTSSCDNDNNRDQQNYICCYCLKHETISNIINPDKENFVLHNREKNYLPMK